MSTRCHIVVVDDDEKRHYIYHHYDGYPWGVGSELKEILKICPSYDWETIMEKILEYDDQYEEDTKIHGDEEYIYEIYADNTKSQLRCFKSGGAKLERLVWVEDYPENISQSLEDQLNYELSKYSTVSEKQAFLDGWHRAKCQPSESVIRDILGEALNTVPDLSDDLDSWVKYIKDRLENGG